MAVYGGSKTTPRYLVDILSKEIGYRGVTVNSIIPFAVDHSGIFAEAGSYPELRKQLLDSCPMGRQRIGLCSFCIIPKYSIHGFIIAAVHFLKSRRGR